MRERMTIGAGRLAGLAALLVVAAGGCSSKPDSPRLASSTATPAVGTSASSISHSTTTPSSEFASESLSTSSVEASSSAAPSGEPEATVRQVASFIAEYDTKIRRAFKPLDECRYGFSDPQCTSASRFGYMTASLVAATLAVEMGGRIKPGHVDYQGAIPQEIRRLYAETLAAAEAADKALQLPVGCSSPTPASNCEVANVKAENAASDLLDKLDAWKPYM